MAVVIVASDGVTLGKAELAVIRFTMLWPYTRSAGTDLGRLRETRGRLADSMATTTIYVSWLTVNVKRTGGT